MQHGDDPIIDLTRGWDTEAQTTAVQRYASPRARGLLQCYGRDVELSLSILRRTPVPYGVSGDLTGWALGSLINLDKCRNIGARGRSAFALGDLPFKAGFGTATRYVNPLEVVALVGDPCPLVATAGRWAERAEQDRVLDPEGLDACLLTQLTGELLDVLNGLAHTPVAQSRAEHITAYALGSLRNMPGCPNVGVHGSPEFALGQLPFRPGHATPGKLYLAYARLRELLPDAVGDLVTAA